MMKPTRLISAALIINILLLGSITFGSDKKDTAPAPVAETGTAKGDKAPVPALVEGYGTTKWGQSIEEVTEILGEGAEVSGQSCRISNEGVAVENFYGFFDGKLHVVRVTYELPGRPETGRDTEAMQQIHALIGKKYREDLDVREALEKAGIAIFVSANNNGQVLVTYRNKTVRRDAQRARQEAEQLEREATISDKDKAGRAAALDTIEDQL
jgi:hypothetical protein